MHNTAAERNMLGRMVIAAKSPLSGALAFPALESHAKLIRSHLCYLKQVSGIQAEDDAPALDSPIGYFRIFDPIVVDAVAKWLSAEYAARCCPVATAVAHAFAFV